MTMQRVRWSTVSPTFKPRRGLNGDTLSTKATSGAGRPRLSTVKSWIKLISSQNDTHPTFFERVLLD
ncbi:Protocadherin gamma-C4 [Dissostichus eleginoides]|uniref:Protocadherin gamma-C4 n=1 Tax=Dissostichus eleginoides TaxID=100907 RepID=A0AAD9BC26_DISEL|nr:Protocadherin gamma-C4 [Dissostichus eleginoides]